MRKFIGLVVGVLALLSVAPGVRASDDNPSSLASYHGRTIDLSKSWEGATACWIADDGNSCYDSRAEMWADHGQPLGRGLGGPILFANCSSAVELFDGTAFGGSSIALATRGSWLALSTWGFSGITSSYSIGACAATLADASTSYPGSTGAGASASTMTSGWNNRVTRVYIA